LVVVIQADTQWWCFDPPAALLFSFISILDRSDRKTSSSVRRSRHIIWCLRKVWENWKELRAGEIMPGWKGNEVDIGKWGIAGYSPTQFWEKLRFGVNSLCSPNLNFVWKLCWPKFGSGSFFPVRKICLQQIGVRRLISVRIELAGGLDYLPLKEYPWISFSLTVTILDRYCWSRFSTSQLTLKASWEQCGLRIWRRR